MRNMQKQVNGNESKKKTPNTHLCWGLWLALKVLSPWMSHLSTWWVLYTGLGSTVELCFAEESPPRGPLGLFLAHF